MPEELWMEVHDIVQEARIKTIPKQNECKNAKWLSEEALQIAVKRREVKGKGEKERYTHLNVEFQRIARRDKKAFRPTWLLRIGHPIQAHTHRVCVTPSHASGGDMDALHVDP